MRKTIIFTLFVLVSVFGLSACNSDLIVKSDVGNITKEEFYDELKDNYGENQLYLMVLTKVLEDKYDASEEDIDNRIELLKEQQGQQFYMWLYQQGFSSEEEEEFRDNIYDMILQEEFQFEGLEATEEEMQEMFDELQEERQIEIQASHILFKFNEEDEEENKDIEDVKKTAQDVKKKLDEGEDFEELAKEYSEDSSAENGGDLGYFKAGEMVPEFEDTAYSLKEGEISNPVKSEHGYHIIKVTDIKTFEDKQDFLRYAILSEKVEEQEIQERLQNTLKDANIDVKIDEFKELFSFPDQPGENLPTEE